mmetsp:Transcript_38057/g.89097  ORF Transcript_38057/g.89097 Transcript_38057/m.89097 type:complete len:196 (-) Transcript_38057:543-1130(-)
MLGALILEMPLSGLKFECGTGFKDAERNLAGAKRRWPVGTIITYKFQNLTKKGVPRFPVFLRERTDKTWAEVLSDAQKDIDDRAAAAAVPPIKRAPSLMARLPASEGGEDRDSILPVKQASSGPMFTDDLRVDAVAVTAAECAPSKTRLAEDAEPRITRGASSSTAAPRATAALHSAGKRKRDVRGGGGSGCKAA